MKDKNLNFIEALKLSKERNGQAFRHKDVSSWFRFYPGHFYRTSFEELTAEGYEMYGPIPKDPFGQGDNK